MNRGETSPLHLWHRLDDETLEGERGTGRCASGRRPALRSLTNEAGIGINPLDTGSVIIIPNSKRDSIKKIVPEGKENDASFVCGKPLKARQTPKGLSTPPRSPLSKRSDFVERGETDCLREEHKSKTGGEEEGFEIRTVLRKSRRSHSTIVGWSPRKSRGRDDTDETTAKLREELKSLESRFLNIGQASGADDCNTEAPLTQTTSSAALSEGATCLLLLNSLESVFAYRCQRTT